MTPGRERAFTPRIRTAYRVTSAGLTGLATFVAVAATGWVSSIAAGDYGRKQEQKAQRAEAAAERAAKDRAAWLRANPVVKVVEKRRPHRTVIRTVVAGSGTVTPGPGGTIRRTAGSTGATSGTSSTPAQPAAPPPPPPPPPPPAPSSGS